MVAGRLRRRRVRRQRPRGQPGRVVVGVDEPVHVVCRAGVQGVLLLLQPGGVGEDVVALSLLPQVVELHELAHGASPHLLLLDHVEVLAVQPETWGKAVQFGAVQQMQIFQDWNKQWCQIRN